MMLTSSIRRKAFRAALAISDQSQIEWSKDHNIGHHHVGLVAKGKRTSKHLTDEIDAYTRRVLLPFVEEYRKRA